MTPTPSGESREELGRLVPDNPASPPSKWTLPLGGFLRGIRIEPLIELPNMDASNPYVLVVQLRPAYGGDVVPINVYGTWEGIE